jgi:hypothetical protein
MSEIFSYLYGKKLSIRITNGLPLTNNLIPFIPTEFFSLLRKIDLILSGFYATAAADETK